MRARHVVTALAVLFFLLPVGLRAVGVTARPFENRALAPKPSLDSGWNVFDETTRFFVDRMPLREQAVRAHARVSLDVLDVPPTWRADLITARSGTAALPGQGPPPPAEGPPAEGPKTEPQSPAAIRGEDGWLFLGEDLTKSCALAPAVDGLVPHMRRIVRALERGGRRVVIAVAPDKTTIYDGQVPDDTPQLDCARATRKRLWPALEGAPDRQILAPRTELIARQQATDERIYQRTDSHWNGLASISMVELVLERISDDVRMRPDEVKAGPVFVHKGDLSVTLGLPDTERAPERLTRPRPGTPRLPGKTVLVHDSFGLYMNKGLEPYAERFQMVSWSGETPATLARAIRGADQVVLQVVERELGLAFAQGGTFDQVVEALG